MSLKLTLVWLNTSGYVLWYRHGFFHPYSSYNIFSLWPATSSSWSAEQHMHKSLWSFALAIFFVKLFSPLKSIFDICLSFYKIAPMHPTTSLFLCVCLCVFWLVCLKCQWSHPMTNACRYDPYRDAWWTCHNDICLILLPLLLRCSKGEEVVTNFLKCTQILICNKLLEMIMSSHPFSYWK